MMKLLRTEPVLLRALLLAILAVVAAIVPDVEIGAIEGAVTAGILLLFGVDLRGKVTPA